MGLNATFKRLKIYRIPNTKSFKENFILGSSNLLSPIRQEILWDAYHASYFLRTSDVREKYGLNYRRCSYHINYLNKLGFLHREKQRIRMTDEELIRTHNFLLSLVLYEHNTALNAPIN